MPETYYIDYCEADGDADWCAYACTDANGGNTWYFDFEITYACSNNVWTNEAANAEVSVDDLVDRAALKRMIEQKMADTQAQEA